jgi:hypothetical protein
MALVGARISRLEAALKRSEILDGYFGSIFHMSHPGQEMGHLLPITGMSVFEDWS